MPPPPVQQESSDEIQPMKEEGVQFSLADYARDDCDTDMYPLRPYPGMAHDREAGGSGTQLDYGSEFAESIFCTPPASGDICGRECLGYCSQEEQRGRARAL